MWVALRGTFHEITLRPVLLFSRLDLDPKEGPPYALPFLIHLPASVVIFVVGLGDEIARVALALTGTGQGVLPNPLSVAASAAIGLTLPITATVLAVVTAVLCHPWLWLLGERDRPLRGTFVLASYAQCISAWQAVPVFGTFSLLLCPLWMALAVRHALRASWWVAAIVAVLPFLCGSLILGVLGLAAYSAEGS